MNPRAITRAAFGLGSALAITIPLQQATAYFHGGSWSGDRSNWNYHGVRGTASGGSGSWSASGYRGGSASGGGGSWSGTTFRGGTASGGEGSWHATGAAGGTASGSHYYGGTYYHGGSYYYGYHPPTVINNYAAGCYNCGGWNAGAAWAAGVTGAAVGATVGAAAASSANAAANANAYAAGVAAGAATAAGAPVYVMNNIYPTLPSGCTYSPAGGIAYYQCGGTWFSPYYGANGMYYRVVPQP